jgi:hypothetical protein
MRGTTQNCGANRGKAKRASGARKETVMGNDAMFEGVFDVLEKMILSPDEARQEALERSSVKKLENMAKETYFRIREKADFLCLLEDILATRVRKLNKDFEWTNERIKKFLTLDDKLTEILDSANKEALAVARALEKRAENEYRFVKSHTVFIKIDAYTYIDEYSPNAVDEEIDEWETSIWETLHRRRQMIGLRGAVNLYPVFFDKNPGYLDKSESRDRNAELLKGVFAGVDFCYAMHELLCSGIWSLPDILNIKAIEAQIQVEYANLTKIDL